MDFEVEHVDMILMCFVYFSSRHPLPPFCTFFTPAQNLATFGPDDRVLHGST